MSPTKHTKYTKHADQCDRLLLLCNEFLAADEYENCGVLLAFQKAEELNVSQFISGVE
jgi:hypothetical protein